MLLAWFFMTWPAAATTYYVSSVGSDTNDGLTVSTAWLSLDHGDDQKIMQPGDTVLVLPGFYPISSGYSLLQSGTPSHPIVYRRFGKGEVRMEGNSTANAIVQLSGSNLIVEGFHLINAKDDAVVVFGDSCVVRFCFMDTPGKRGIRNDGNDCLFYRNVIAYAGDDGIKNEDAAKRGNKYYHNTIYQPTKHGVEIRASVEECRIVNCVIIESGDNGILGPSGTVCAFNNVWGSLNGDYDGVVDSAGGISSPPHFIDQENGRFDLRSTADEIDAGLDLGYRFNGAAPDMGAFEKYNTYFVSPDGDDSGDGLDIASAWKTIDNGDSLLYPGDTVYVMAGVYADSVVITNGGETGDEIVYAGVRDSTIIRCTSDQGVLVQGENLVLEDLAVIGADGIGFLVTGSNDLLKECRTDSCAQYGIFIESPANGAVERSLVANSGVTGIIVEANGARILNCTFVGNGDFDVDAIAGDGLQLINGIFVGGDSPLSAIRASSSAAIRHGEFYNHPVKVLGGATLGTGCFTADPLFLDEAAGFYRLKASSPAIDVGADLGIEYTGPAPDLGAYETGIPSVLTILPELDSMAADSQYQFTVEAVDSLGYPTKPGTLAWSHTFATGGITTAGLFTPQLVGTGSIIVTSTTYGLADTVAAIEVVPGELAALEITPEPDTVSADSTVQFSAAATDSKGNEVSDPGALTWSVISGIGTIDGSGLFSATRAGIGFVRVASDGGVTTTSSAITVIPGDVAYIDVTPEVNIITQSSTHQYYALGYDADSNVTEDLTTQSSWSTTQPFGSVDAAGLFTASLTTSPPAYWVKAEWSGFSDSGQVSVLFAGALAYVKIEYLDGSAVDDTLLTTDNDTTTFYARGYSALDNLLGDVACTWSVIDTDSIGTAVTAKGTSTRLQLTRVGTGHVVASYSAGMADTSGVITCFPGVPATLQITPDTAITVNADSQLTFDDQYLDADGNPASLAPISDWSVIGSIGTISVSGQFTPDRTGQGRVIASSLGKADTSAIITVVPGALVRISVSPDTAVVAADSSLQFAATGYDAKDNTRDPGTVTWQLTELLGVIDNTGYFEPATAGTARVIATSDSGPSDTTSVLDVIAGAMTTLVISPDSAEISSDSSLAFTVAAFDGEGNPVEPAKILWSTAFGLGDISTTGQFDPLEAGVDRVIARCPVGVDTVADTSKAVVILPGSLDRLNVVPGTATINLGDSIQFSTIGYDHDFNVTDVGPVLWTVTGGIGVIDTSGLFRAQNSGTGQITASSTETGVMGTTDLITVEALRVSAEALSDQTIRPDDTLVVLLKCRLTNAFSRQMVIDSFAVRPAFSGAGSPDQLLSNVDSVHLYIDRNNDSRADAGDELLATVAPLADRVSFDPDPILIEPDTAVVVLVAVDASLFPADSDTLDFFVMTHEDIIMSDGSPIEAQDSLNSSGVASIDGMIGRQIQFEPRSFDSLVVADSMFYLASIDLPRNGYRVDTLKAINIANDGTASESDIDSLLLFADDGDGVWSGAASETRVAKLVFTGSQWTRTGISRPLTNQFNRFHLAAAFSRFANNGSSVLLSIPQNGIGVSSANDGPIDGDLSAGDSVIILTDQKVELSALAIAERSIVPGSNSGPILGLRMSNGTETTISVRELTLSLVGTDPDGASQNDLDSQVDSVGLYLAGDADYGVIGSTDLLLATSTIVNGVADWSDLDVTISAADGVADFLVAAWLNLSNAKDANTIGFRLEQAADISVDPAVNVSGTFPVETAAKFTINAFPANGIVFSPTGTGTVFGGEKNELALNVLIPSDGYSRDTLNTIRIDNYGTLFDGVITGMHLYADVDPAGFGAEDKLLANMLRLGEIWTASNLRYPVPSGGAHLLVSVDISGDAFQGGTFEPGIPIGGLVYGSGMTGPDDEAARPNEHILVFAPNRVTAVSLPLGTSTIHPGTSDATLLAFALYNGYVGESRHLNRVSLTNTTRSRSNDEWADHTVGQMRLYYDANRNHFLDDDSLVGTGIFTDGRLTFSGMDIEIPAESLSYFFVTATCPFDAIDADSLAAVISGASEFGFAETVSLNGDLPLARGGYLVVDGSMAAQYRIDPLASRSLNPGDEDVVLFSFQPAFNGDQVDTLTGLTFKNVLDADDIDISTVRLWSDANADKQWQSTDASLGSMEYVAGSWQISGLSHEIQRTSPSLIVTANVTDTARTGHAFRPYLDVNGCVFKSGNDGPIDVSVTSNVTFTISSSALQVQYGPVRRSCSVGETVAITLNVTNMLGLSLDSVYGVVSVSGDELSVVPDSSHSGPISLPADSSVTFTYYYTASQSGTVVFKSKAIAAVVADTSVTIGTEPISIQSVPSGLRLALHNFMPTAVARGQHNVFPLSLELSHAGTPNAASILLKSIVISVMNSSGTAQPANSALTRILLADDNSTLTSVTSIPATSGIALPLSPNLLLRPGDTTELVLLVDISDSAMANSLVMGIETAGAIEAVDANTDLPVTILPSTTPPIRTASCRIDDPTTALAISSVSRSVSSVNAGQINVPMLKIGVRHPGETGTSQVQLVGLSLILMDGADTLIGSSVVDRIAVYRASELLGQVTGTILSRKLIPVDLGSGLTVNPNASDSLTIAISVAPGIVYDSFQVILPDSSLVEIRDVASGSEVAAVTDREALATGSVFPIQSPVVQVYQPAREAEFCLSDDLPLSVVAGSDSVSLLSMSLAYDQPSNSAPLRVSRLSLLFLDSLGTPLDPGKLLDRTAYRVGSGATTYHSSLTLINGATVFPLGDLGVVIAPSESIDISLLADFESDNPYDNFRVVLSNIEAIGIEDANDSLHIPVLHASTECSTDVPYESRVTGIFMPAGAPRFEQGASDVRIACAGQSGFVIGTESFAYTGSIRQGDIEFRSLSVVVFKYDRNSETVVPASGIFTSAYLSDGEKVVASDSILGSDTVHLAVEPSLVLAHGSVQDISLLADIRPDAAPGNYRVKLVDSTAVELRDRNLGGSIYPLLSSGAYPATLSTISISASSLEASFANYPNPFIPSEGSTTITYVLPEDAYVDIDLFTITGEPVAQIAENEFRSAGPHQDETWNGLNDAGLRVVPGTYFCRITVRYISGRTESARRKVAVIR